MEALQYHISSLKPLVIKQTLFAKTGDIHFDLPPSLGLEDVVQKVPDAKLVYTIAGKLSTKIVERARAQKFNEDKQKLDDLKKNKEK